MQSAGSMLLGPDTDAHHERTNTPSHDSSTKRYHPIVLS